MSRSKYSYKRLIKNQTLIVMMSALAVLGTGGYFWLNRTSAPSPAAVNRDAKPTPVVAESKEDEAEKEPVAFEFPAEGPIRTYHMDHDREAIITMTWGKKTWAHIEHFSSIVYPNEPTVLELEEPEPGLYPLKLDSGEIRGYVQVD